MPSRSHSVMATDHHDDTVSPVLSRLRGMWQFANLCQWIYIFGKVAKIDESLEIEDIEAECLKPSSTVLANIGLSLLKLVSSHRGLTGEIFDEQLRKQYTTNLPHYNPLLKGVEPRAFAEVGIYNQIIILQQLTQWIMMYPERLREKMEEQRDSDQTSWRIEPYGWDSLDRTYYVLDDNRIYRSSKPSVTSRPQKRNFYGAGRRSSKRRRLSDISTERYLAASDDEVRDLVPNDFGGMTWECVAVTLDDVRSFLQTFHKTRDDNEKVLRKRVEVHLIPILEKQEESQRRKQAFRDRELLNIAKMANAKRSSRIADRDEQRKQDERLREEEKKLLHDELEKQRGEQRRREEERERERRLLSRESRLREREVRRRRHEQELAHLSSEDGKNGSDMSTRISERRLVAEIERNKQALKEIDAEEEDWVFDCVCGLYGQVDDGAHSVACERCNVWQHSKCLGIRVEEAEDSEFHFICAECRRRVHAIKSPRRTTIKIKIKAPIITNSPESKLSSHATPQGITSNQSNQHNGLSSMSPVPSPSLQEANIAAAGLTPASVETGGERTSQGSQTSTAPCNHSSRDNAVRHWQSQIHETSCRQGLIGLPGSSREQGENLQQPSEASRLILKEPMELDSQRPAQATEYEQIHGVTSIHSRESSNRDLTKIEP